MTATGVAGVRREFLASAGVKRDLAHGQAEAVALMADALVATLRRGGRIYLCGNGGSAADAQHIAAELIGTFLDRSRRALPAVALTTDTSALTAIANDLGYDQVFSRQVEALMTPKDALIAISTSGRSANVLAAARSARRIGARVLALTGTPGKPLEDLADLAVRVPSRDTQRIQECHITVGHVLCGRIEKAYAPGRKKS